MEEGEWGVRIVSAQREVTEAVLISREGLDSLLNAKTEFGSNHLSELGVKSCDLILMQVRRK